MNAAADRITVELRGQGVLSFARFMELALYCPLCGYYEQEADTLGRRGDYYTSPSVGSLFGELLAFQFAQWLREDGTPDAEHGAAAAPTAARQLVEAGAHDGALARDILTWLRARQPELFAALEYWIVEPSRRREQWQRGNLREFANTVRWTESLASLGQNCAGGVCGVIFSNELLDAMPVRRVGWDAAAQAWFEWGVALADEGFKWMRMSAASSPPEVLAALLKDAGLGLPPALASVLPDGFTTEVCPAATDWWRAAATALRAGKLVAIDYGMSAEELLSAHRPAGTLRAYRHHRATADVLAHPGQQDLTAHVNFTAVERAGEAAGLRTEAFDTQAQFLTRIAAQTWENPSAFGEWNATRRRQFQTLTHPEHLGRAFRVLIQAR